MEYKTKREKGKHWLEIYSRTFILVYSKGKGKRGRNFTKETTATYFCHRVHLLPMGGDSAQALSRRTCRRVTLLHQIRKIDVACKAVAGRVARALFVTRRLQRNKLGRTEEKNNNKATTLTYVSQQA